MLIPSGFQKNIGQTKTRNRPEKIEIDRHFPRLDNPWSCHLNEIIIPGVSRKFHENFKLTTLPLMASCPTSALRLGRWLDLNRIDGAISHATRYCATVTTDLTNMQTVPPTRPSHPPLLRPLGSLAPDTTVCPTSLRLAQSGASASRRFCPVLTQGAEVSIANVM